MKVLGGVEMRRILFLMLSVITLFLSSCGNSITKGEVVEKQFVPEHSVLMYVPISMYNGKTCTTIIVPYTYN